MANDGSPKNLMDDEPTHTFQTAVPAAAPVGTPPPIKRPAVPIRPPPLPELESSWPQINTEPVQPVDQTPVALPDVINKAAKRNLTLIADRAQTAGDHQRRSLLSLGFNMLVWSLVVAMIGTAGWLVWHNQPGRVRRAIARIKWLEKLYVQAMPQAAKIGKPPAPAQALLERGLSLYSQHQYQQSAQVLEQALHLDASIPQLHRALGIVYATLHQPNKAVEHYQQYVKLAPAAGDVAAVRQILTDYNQTLQHQPASPAPLLPAPTTLHPHHLPSKPARHHRARRLH